MANHYHIIGCSFGWPAIWQPPIAAIPGFFGIYLPEPMEQAGFGLADAIEDEGFEVIRLCVLCHDCWRYLVIYDCWCRADAVQCEVMHEV
jgi:hypothetical protein